MPPTLYVNSVKTLTCDMRKGVVHGLTQLVRVSGLIIDDHGALLEPFAVNDLPKYTDKLNRPGFEALIAVDHHIVMLDDPGWADVTITYKHPLEEEAAQNLTFPVLGSIYSLETGQGMFQIYGKMQCSLQQRPTNFYPIRYDDGTIATFKTIKVFHDFTKNPGEKPPGKDMKDIQGGSINVQVPVNVYKFGGVVVTNTPWLLAELLIGSINSDIWLYKDAFEWMCTEVAWQILTLGTFKFEFQMTSNPDTWLYTPVWVWPDTNKPHAKPIEDEDYWEIHYHREVNFGNAFGSFFENYIPDPT